MYPLKNVPYVENFTVLLFIQLLEPLSQIPSKSVSSKDGTYLKSQICGRNCTYNTSEDPKEKVFLLRKRESMNEEKHTGETPALTRV